MSFVRLLFCVAGVYTMFLLWAIAQERLSVPFQTIDSKSSHRFHFALFIGICQSALSCISALLYLLIRRQPSSTLSSTIGLTSSPSPTPQQNAKPISNGTAKPLANGNGAKYHPKQHHTHPPSIRRSLLLRYLQCSFLITCAAPFGFAALSYIPYPAMVLGKSCKLVPVMLMNVVLYRRKFVPYKYLVVAMVTTGITIFMGFSDSSKRKSHGSSPSTVNRPPYANLIGCTYLLINLALDGAINSTQDEIFARYRPTGQQMMFWINLFCTLISTSLCLLPLPYIPVLHPSNDVRSEFAAALEFIIQHPSIVSPLAQFACTGALGQLFIFETLQHFGSLTLVTITLTRKLFTLLLSVAIYNHKLALGQWFGAAVVFAGISVEAYVKRKDVHAKRVIAEKEKAKLKSL